MFTHVTKQRDQKHTRKSNAGNVLQRNCTCGKHTVLGGECAACSKQRPTALQRTALKSTSAQRVHRTVQTVLQSPGQPLSSAMRAYMEPRLGQVGNGVQRSNRSLSPSLQSNLATSQPNDRAEQEATIMAEQALSESSPSNGARQDFSDVRVHVGEQAAQSAQAINADAYTVGQHIVFGKGQYRPHTVSGRKLLAHELTHAVQQRSGAQRIHRQAGSTSAPPVPVNGGLADEMLRQIARRLRAAMAGLGTDESAIYGALSGRTQAQIDAIDRVYTEMHRRSLMHDLQDELSESELQHLGIFAPTAPAEAVESTSPAESNRMAEMVAGQLNDAMRGLGTDESAIYAALTGRTVSERQAIREAYRRLTNHTLEADLRDELSGSELTQGLMLLNQGMLQPEDELYLAIEGLGTDEETIFRELDGLAGDNSAISHMEANYRTKYGDLIADLRGDLSAQEYARAMRILRPTLQDVAFDDCSTTVIPQVRTLIPIGIRKVEKAISVLSRGWANMSTAEKAVFNRFFDPSGAGVDERFVRDVLANYHKIRREFDNDLTVECETGGGICEGGRLYYTYWSNIHVCPYFLTETDVVRKQRDFVHELAHNALLAVDRPYYQPNSAEYAAQTPRGSWTGQIPVVGPLFRLISRSDTLNAPDAYSYFAFTVR